MQLTLRISLLLAAMAALALLGGCPGGEAGDGANASAGQQGSAVENAAANGSASSTRAPEIIYSDFEGKGRKLSEHFGKPLVVNFWAVWCPPCVAELPHFQEVYTEKAGQFELLAICVDNQQDPPGFFAANGLTFQAGILSTQLDATYNLGGVPVTVFIDREGNIVHKQLGGMDKATFEGHLAKIL